MTELEFAQRLKKLRKAKNMTQQELADLLGVSNKSVSRWETGGYPDVAMLGPLAKALGVTVDDLLGETPPIRTLGRADWQNLLSFAFAIGGGVLFFLFDLFAPTVVCYLLYLGAMAYGVYLQRHYTCHSRWFHAANLVMDFFVNVRLVTPVVTLYSFSLSSLVGAATSGAVAPALWLRAYFPCLLLAAALTVLTQIVIRRKGSPELPNISLPRLRRAAFSPSRLPPVLIPILTSCFWLLYTMDKHKAYAISPKWFYTAQDPLFYGLTLLLTVLAAGQKTAVDAHSHAAHVLGLCRPVPRRRPPFHGIFPPHRHHLFRQPCAEPDRIRKVRHPHPGAVPFRGSHCGAVRSVLLHPIRKKRENTVTKTRPASVEAGLVF